MARKGWDALSPGYRSRLEKAGISKADYTRGESIQAARGHARTPERPRQAAAFPQYQSERNRLSRKVLEKKQAFFGGSPKWNPKRAARRFKEDPPSMIELRRWERFTREEMIDAIREDSRAATYIGYH